MKDFEAALSALPGATAELRRLRERVDLKQGIIELGAGEVSAKPHLVWSAFTELLLALPFEKMTKLQRSAHLTLIYDGEVQNGGHLQFFVNSAGRSSHAVAAALDRLSLPAHGKQLRKAHARWLSQPTVRAIVRRRIRRTRSGGRGRGHRFRVSQAGSHDFRCSACAAGTASGRVRPDQVLRCRQATPKRLCGFASGAVAAHAGLLPRPAGISLALRAAV